MILLIAYDCYWARHKAVYSRGLSCGQANSFSSNEVNTCRGGVLP